VTRTAMLTNDALETLNTARSLPVLAVIGITFAACVTTWVTRRRTRRCLDHLEGWQLRDVGLTPCAAFDEARKVFWRT
jgi:uncharacterized protein YjiS (DUF1127 family)